MNSSTQHNDFENTFRPFQEQSSLLQIPKKGQIQVPSQFKKKGVGLKDILPPVARRRGVAQKLNIGQMTSLAIASQQNNPENYFVNTKKKDKRETLNQDEMDAMVLGSLMRKLVDKKKEKGLNELQTKDQRRRNNLFRDHNLEKAQELAVLHF